MTLLQLRQIAARLTLEPWVGLEREDLVQEGWLRAHALAERGASRGVQEAGAWRAMQDAMRVALRRVGMGRTTTASTRRSLLLSIEAVEEDNDLEPGDSTRSREEAPGAAIERRDQVRRGAEVLGLEGRDLRIVLGALLGERLWEAGERLGVSESRVCQLRAPAFDRAGLPRPRRGRRGR